MLDKITSFLLIGGVVLFLMGIIYLPFSIAGLALIVVFLILMWFLIAISIPGEFRKSITQYKSKRAEESGREQIRATAKPEVIRGRLGTYHAQGMSGQLLIIDSKANRNDFDVLTDGDYLKIFEEDDSVLWEGYVDMKYRRASQKLFHKLTSKEKTQLSLNQDTWLSWFTRKPALLAELSRYHY